MSERDDDFYTDKETLEMFEIIDMIEDGDTEDLVAEIYEWEEAYADAVSEQDQAITDEESS